MQRAIRLLLLIEGIGYVVAGTIHAGAPGAGAAHRQASIAESVIAVVLLVGFALTWIAPAQTRRIGIGAQGFALLLTLPPKAVPLTPGASCRQNGRHDQS